MSVKMKGGATLSADDITACEIALGVKLPADYRAFVAHNDGARPEGNRFDLDGTNGFGVNDFIPLASTAKERRYLDNLPTTRFPVAWDESGNYVCLETAGGGGVFFWDHEEPHVEYRLAETFGEFLEKLQPASPSDAQLNPADVKRAWIDPDFLRQIQEEE